MSTSDKKGFVRKEDIGQILSREIVAIVLHGDVDGEAVLITDDKKLFKFNYLLDEDVTKILKEIPTFMELLISKGADRPKGFQMIDAEDGNRLLVTKWIYDVAISVLDEDSEDKETVYEYITNCRWDDELRYEDTFISTYVDISHNDEYVMTLGGGIPSVVKFAGIADIGIEGAITTEVSFHCNRDVTILGADLLKFIEKEYPEYYDRACEKVVYLNEIYEICCFDLS